VGREHEVGLENDERLSRQRARRAFPEHVEPSLRRGEMVAIEDLRDPLIFAGICSGPCG